MRTIYSWRTHLSLWLILSLFLTASLHASEFATVAEKTDYRLTSTYEETVDYARRLDSASEWIHMEQFGTTPQGRAMHVLVVSNDGVSTPAEATATGKVVVLLFNGIHAGEICGKEASFALLRDIAITREKQHLLDSVIILDVPIFSIDGHENNERDTRSNQYGPENSGFRATAEGYNLNRDFLKAESVEMRAWLRLWQRWQPDFLIDDHVTDGVDWQYEISYTLPWNATDTGIRDWINSTFDPDMVRRVEKTGYKIFPYAWPTGTTYKSGVATYVAGPRYSTGYADAWNRPGMLVEIHSLKDFKTRVLANYTCLNSVFESLNVNASSLRTAIGQADAAVARGLNASFPLSFERTSDSVMVNLAGYEHDTVRSEVSGGMYIKYDRDKPRTFHVPYYNTFESGTAVIPPRAYLIPQEWVAQIERLERHGVELSALTAPLTTTVERFHLDSTRFSEAPYEGQFQARFVSTARETTMTFPTGTVVVDLRQPGAKLIMHALEPDGRDSFVRWGFWHTIFERKEYIEGYTIDPMAEKMLVSDRALRAEFEALLAADTSFAHDVWARRQFFYRRTPHYEQQIGWYPVVRLMGDLPKVEPFERRSD